MHTPPALAAARGGGFATVPRRACRTSRTEPTCMSFTYCYPILEFLYLLHLRTCYALVLLAAPPHVWDQMSHVCENVPPLCMYATIWLMHATMQPTPSHLCQYIQARLDPCRRRSCSPSCTCDKRGPHVCATSGAADACGTRGADCSG